MRNPKPLVSVCVITYNHAAYIKECLDSILTQHVDFEYEICIGEDCSTDGTREICQEYAQQHKDVIRLFLRERKDVIHLDGSPTGTYNFFETLRQCRGDYIAICEGDDYWIDVDKLSKQIELLASSPSFSVCYSNVSVVYDDGRDAHPAYAEKHMKRKIRHRGIGIIEKPTQNVTLKDLARRNCVHTPGVVFKNWIKGGQLPSYVWKCGLGDWALHMSSARYGDLVFVDDELAAYRVHQGGVWSHVDELKQQRTIVGTCIAMLEAKLFPSDVEGVLREKVFKIYKRAWRRKASARDTSLISSLLCKLACEAPDLMPDVVRRLRSQRFFL